LTGQHRQVHLAAKKAQVAEESRIDLQREIENQEEADAQSNLTSFCTSLDQAVPRSAGRLDMGTDLSIVRNAQRVV
jgi:hypothetical protein